MTWDARQTGAIIAACVLIALLLGWRHVTHLPWIPGTVDFPAVALGSERLDPNIASDGSLQRLPGIGPTLAGAIVTYRRSQSPPAFATPEDLTDVPGIGRIRARRIEPYLVFPPMNEGDDGE
jgi:competence ComEA-like helix-hairpin-helix protein